jgi:phenylalanyl-tRNA synthetase beta chain
MKILTSWLREFLPAIPVDDEALADDLTLRGIAVEGVSPAADSSSIFEMDITTNRVDAMNHYGVAREAAAIYSLDLPPLAPHLPPSESAPAFPVEIAEPSLCGRFTARVLRNISIGDSRGIVKDRFAALGLKPISNAVDASNYVLQAMGHPTHAFDLDKISGGRIIVRLARTGEKLRTLDGIERTLTTDDLVIADAERAISLAGIIGGWDTMITAATRNVLIEAAWFDPVRVRQSARRHGLHTDASHRFERGADFAAPPIASALVAQLILADGGQPSGDLTDSIVADAAARTLDRPTVPLHLSEIHRILGRTLDSDSLTASTIAPILTSLGCKLRSTAVELSNHDAWSVTLPSWRLDLNVEIDLIEEVARVYGYNRFANTLPAFSGAVVELPTAAPESAVRRTLLAAGYNEAIASTFCSAADAELFAASPGSIVPLGNPLSEEAGVLRPSLLPGMLAMLAHNLNHGADHVRLFESGTIFSTTPSRDASARPSSADPVASPGRVSNIDHVGERPSLALGLTGSVPPSPLYSPDDAPFYALKGAIEATLKNFSSTSLYFDSLAAPALPDLQPGWIHPHRSARIVLDGMTLGWLGQLHPDQAEARKLRQPVYLAEIALDRLFHHALRTPSAREISRFPAVHRDFSFIVPDSVTWQRIAIALQESAIPFLVSYALQEIFRDPKGLTVPAAHQSILLRATFQSPDRTLVEDELQSSARALIAALTSIGGTLRA